MASLTPRTKSWPRSARPPAKRPSAALRRFVRFFLFPLFPAALSMMSYCSLRVNRVLQGLLNVSLWVYIAAKGWARERLCGPLFAGAF